ncbi:hypothetical protein BU26DRAFT_589502 [Trematosphaeria pertusa]|uniref:Extracellular membrane protein CFEM domain-containing protein n=1 Tax=Trematosphaeria pertusa TaxID=390896 RepID=A0A6A6HQ70_9PLEO|nr:uncharacterized protein BU26DRAFT_589502 [Trematosphaeria pertusa]KAF2240294.1 hypothetical protein BU26DRAFT_589502 [Trematosphaeria pertusa]
MRLLTILFTLLVSSPYASARPDEDEDEGQSSTITSSATLACASGDAKSKYEFCSSSISSKIDECDDNDLACACTLANSGFNCLTFYCPTHTEAVCAGSLALHNLCALVNAPQPILTHLSCPSTIPDLLATLIPSPFRSLIPSDVESLLPSDINSRIPTVIPFFNGEETGVTSTTDGGSGGGQTGSGTAMQVPSQTGAAGANKGWTRGAGAGGGGEGEGLRVFLGVGIVVSIAVGWWAAYFLQL